MDADLSDFPDAGERVDYSIDVANAGTVTLKNVEATSTSGDVICATVVQPVPSLGVGASYHCASSHAVRTVRHRASEDLLHPHSSCRMLRWYPFW